MAGAVNGDEQAFRALYQAMQPVVLRYLRTLVGADAEDVASETWLQITWHLATFRGGDDEFRAWSATIARHRALDHLRAVRRRPQVSVPNEVFVERAGPGNTSAEAMDALATERAVAMIASLPREQAEAVMLRVVVGLDAEAAGRVLGKRAGAVRTAAHRGLRRLAVPSGFGPADLRSAYNLTTSGSASTTVAIVDAYDAPTAEADLAAYRTQFGLPACTTANGCFRKVDQNGGTSYPHRNTGWAQEISLDLDMLSAIWPQLPHSAGRGEEQLVRQSRHRREPGGHHGREHHQQQLGRLRRG